VAGDDGGGFDTVRAELKDGPKTFVALMAAIASRDGREVVSALEVIRQDGNLTRREDGEYAPPHLTLTLPLEGEGNKPFRIKE